MGIIDLGGGSVQIVFPTDAKDAPKDYSQQLNFNGRKHELYIKSHLGFGLDAARNAALDALVAKHEVRRLRRRGPSLTPPPPMPPCHR